MFELFDEWRGRAHRHPMQGPADPLGETRDGPTEAPPHEAGPSLEPFDSCNVCEGTRFLSPEPVGGETLRLALVCDSCGSRTEI